MSRDSVTISSRFVGIPVGRGREAWGTQVLFRPLRHTLTHTDGVTGSSESHGPERTKAPMMEEPTETGKGSRLSCHFQTIPLIRVLLESKIPVVKGHGDDLLGTLYTVCLSVCLSLKDEQI